MPPTPNAYGAEWWKSNQKKTKRIRLLCKLSRTRLSQWHTLVRRATLTATASLAWFGSRKSSGDRWTVLKTWPIGRISDSIGLDGFGAKACGGSQGFSISMIG